MIFFLHSLNGKYGGGSGYWSAYAVWITKQSDVS